MLRTDLLVTDRHSRSAPRGHAAGFPRVTVPGMPPVPPAHYAATSPSAHGTGTLRGAGVSRGGSPGLDQMESPKMPSWARRWGTEQLRLEAQLGPPWLRRRGRSWPQGRCFSGAGNRLPEGSGRPSAPGVGGGAGYQRQKKNHRLRVVSSHNQYLAPLRLGAGVGGNGRLGRGGEGAGPERAGLGAGSGDVLSLGSAGLPTHNRRLSVPAPRPVRAPGPAPPRGALGRNPAPDILAEPLSVNIAAVHCALSLVPTCPAHVPHPSRRPECLLLAPLRPRICQHCGETLFLRRQGVAEETWTPLLTSEAASGTPSLGTYPSSQAIPVQFVVHGPGVCRG